MDPLSVAGLAVGVVSLAFELFSACIKGKLPGLNATPLPVVHGITSRLMLELQDTI